MPTNIQEFKIGDEVTLIRGEHEIQIMNWKNKKAIITSIFENKQSAIIKSANGYSNGYNVKDLKLLKRDEKREEKLRKQKENEKVIKQFSKKKTNTLTNHITIYCIKNYNFKIK